MIWPRGDRFQVNPLETYMGTEVETKSHELLSPVLWGLSNEPRVLVMSHPAGTHFHTLPFFSTFKFNQVMGCDYGATISLDPLIAIHSSRGVEGNISQLNKHVCYSCGVARGNQ